MRGRRHNVGLLLLFIVANMTQLGARVVISPVIPQIIDAFDTSKALIGLALSAMWASYALVQYPSGLLGEKYGERAVMLVAIGLTGVGSVLIAASPNYPLFLLFTITLGAGSGLYFTVATVYITRFFDKIGQMLGVHSAGGPIAGLVAPVASAYVGIHYGWRAAVLLGAAVALPLLTLFFVRTSQEPPTHPDVSLFRRVRSEQSLGILTHRPLAFTTLLAGIGYFKWQSFSSFFPTFLIEYLGLSTGEASLVFGVVFAIAIVGLPMLGRLSDAYNRDAIIVFGFLSGAIGYAVFIMMDVPQLPLIAAGTVLLGIGMSWGAVMQARFMDHLTESERGAGFGLVRTIYMLVSSLGSVVTGTLADSMGWPTAYGFIAGLLVFAIALLAINRLAGLDL